MTYRKNNKSNFMKRIISKRKAKQLMTCVMTVVSLALFAGCGEVVEEEQPQEQEPTTLYIYSQDEGFKRFQNLLPDDCSHLFDTAEYIVPQTEDFPAYIEGLLADKTAEKYPDIIIADAQTTAMIRELDTIASIDELGITDKDCEQMYQYTKDYATDSKGVKKAVSMSVCPGAFIYRKALATMYLGSDDAKEVQSYVRDWLTFEDTARAISRHSQGKTFMLASDYGLDIEFTKKNVINTNEYMRAAAGNEVFGYFVTPDFVAQGLRINIDGMFSTLGYVGDWGICRGPVAYADGGSWIFVTSDCSQKEGVAKVIKALCCDMSTMQKIHEGTKIFVNNKLVMSNAMHSGKGKSDALGGLDYIRVFDEQAQDVNVDEIDGIAID